MTRQYLLPVLLTTGAAALAYIFGAIANGASNGIGLVGSYGSLLWASSLFAAVVLPFLAMGFLALMPVIMLVRPRSWPTSTKSFVVVCAGGLLGSLLLAWLSLTLGFFSGTLAAGVWLGVNWQLLRPPAPAGTI